MKRGRPGKLTPARVRAIRRWYQRRKKDSTAAMCKRHGCTKSTLYAIGQRFAYKEVR